MTGKTYELRPYQREAVEAVFDEWGKGNKKTLLVAATGTGKTVVFSEIAKRCLSKSGTGTEGDTGGKKILIIAHRQELLEQAADKLQKVSGLESALEKGSSHAAESDAPVTVASIQTISRRERLEKFSKDDYAAVIIDEAHHCVASTYKRVMRHFDGCRVLGVTATPGFERKKNISKQFDSVAYEYNMADAVKDGYLCPPKALMVPVDIDISHVHTQEGDYVLGELGDAVTPVLDAVADQMVTYCMDRKTLVFLPLVETAKKFQKILAGKGFSAVEVDGSTLNRKEILSDFHDGKYNVICNALLLTEGFDEKSVDCIIMLRPTKIRDFYAQAVGRGMRLSPETGKKDLLILDFLWLTAKHDLCRPACLVTADENLEKRMQKILTSNSGGARDLEKTLAEAIRQIQVEEELRKMEEKRRREEEARRRLEEENRRKAAEEARRLAAEREEREREEREKRAAEQRERQRKTEEEKRIRRNNIKTRLAASVLVNTKKMPKLVDPLQFACFVDDDDVLDPSVGNRPYCGREPSSRQEDVLADYGIDPEGVIDYDQAEALLKTLKERERKGLATPKQIRYLSSKGFKNTESWKKREAHALLDVIAEHRWFIPDWIVPEEYVPGESSLYGFPVQPKDASGHMIWPEGYGAVISDTVRGSGTRYVVINPGTGEIINDASGYGYKTEESAYNSVKNSWYFRQAMLKRKS